MSKPTKQDIAYAATKAVVGSIPIAGAAVSEILSLLVAAPIEKRREKLLTEIGARLKELENSKSINLEDLQDNDQFIDTVLQATSLALKTSETEKIDAFKNAILNTAIGDAPHKTKSQIFLNYIDSFTTWHVRILHLFDNPKKWFERNNQTPPSYVMSSLSSVIKHAYPELKGQDELMDLIWADLHRAAFHRTTDLKTSMSGDGLLAKRTTDLGKEFLEFISYR